MSHFVRAVLPFLLVAMVVEFCPTPSDAFVLPAGSWCGGGQIEVDVSAIEDSLSGQDALAKVVRARVESAIGGVPCLRDDGLIACDFKPVVRVVLWWQEKEALSYGVRVEVAEGGSILYTESTTCKRCDEEGIAVVVEDSISQWLSRQERQITSGRRGSRRNLWADICAADVAPAQPSKGPTQAERRSIGAMGVLGIVSMAIGAGGVSGGFALTREPPLEQLSRESDQKLEVVSRRSVAVSLMGAGTGLIVAGMSFVLIDRALARRRHRRRASSLAVLPMVTAGRAGVSMIRRF